MVKGCSAIHLLKSILTQYLEHTYMYKVKSKHINNLTHNNLYTEHTILNLALAQFESFWADLSGMMPQIILTYFLHILRVFHS